MVCGLFEFGDAADRDELVALAELRVLGVVKADDVAIIVEAQAQHRDGQWRGIEAAIDEAAAKG